VELRPAGRALEILSQNGHGAKVVPAGPDDFSTEWMSLILGVKIAVIPSKFTHTKKHSTAYLSVDSPQ
jgi:hypothetical protein